MKTREMLKVIPLITLALLMSCSGEKKDAATDTHDEKVKVKIEQVSSQDVDQIADFTATVEANIKNNIAPQSPVRIAKLFAEVGDHVKEGQVLVKMDETNLLRSKQGSCSSGEVWRTAKRTKRTCVGALQSKRGSCSSGGVWRTAKRTKRG